MKLKRSMGDYEAGVGAEKPDGLATARMFCASASNASS